MTERDLAKLSDREREVFELLGKCMKYRAIASRLGISFGTVSRHASMVYAKLNIDSHTHIIRYCAGRDAVAAKERP